MVIIDFEIIDIEYSRTLNNPSYSSNTWVARRSGGFFLRASKEAGEVRTSRCMMSGGESKEWRRVR